MVEGEKTNMVFMKRRSAGDRVTELGTATDLYCYDLMAFCGVQ